MSSGAIDDRNVPKGVSWLEEEHSEGTYLADRTISYNNTLDRLHVSPGGLSGSSGVAGWRTQHQQACTL